MFYTGDFSMYYYVGFLQIGSHLSKTSLHSYICNLVFSHCHTNALILH